MEHIVNLPMSGEFKAIVDLSQDLLDSKRPETFVSKFMCGMSGAEILPFQPDTIPFLILVIICRFLQELLCCQNCIICLLPCLEESLLSPLELGEFAGPRGLMCVGNCSHP